MRPLQHQIEKANEAYKILKELKYVYINGQPRSGKTLTAILVAEKCKNVEKVLVLTKKNAIDGWLKFITPNLTKQYEVTNYEKLGRIIDFGGTRAVTHNYRPDSFQLVIFDESHAIGAFPKPSQRQLIIKAFCKELPHIHLSGTPIIESACGIFHQMNVSKYTPFPFGSFYRFFDHYGVPSSQWIRGQPKACYDKFKPELLQKISEFTVYMSQSMAGIKVMAEDREHYVELSEDTKKLYNKILDDKIGFDGKLVCDTTMKLRTALHMIEGGSVKLNDGEILILDDVNEKISYIKRVFGDTKDVGIMAHYISDREKLKKHFKHAQIYSSVGHAEGVDLSHLKYFVIYSSDYSGAKFVQRRERIVNINGGRTNAVHHILVKNAISEQVYKLVSKKRDFNDSTFDRTKL